MQIQNLVALVCLFLCSCAETRIYEYDRCGKSRLVARIQADATNVTFRTPRTYFRAETLDHSSVTIAGGQASTKMIVSGAAVAATVNGSPYAAVFTQLGDWIKNLFH